MKRTGTPSHIVNTVEPVNASQSQIKPLDVSALDALGREGRFLNTPELKRRFLEAAAKNNIAATDRTAICQFFEVFRSASLPRGARQAIGPIHRFMNAVLDGKTAVAKSILTNELNLLSIADSDSRLNDELRNKLSWSILNCGGRSTLQVKEAIRHVDRLMHLFGISLKRSSARNTLSLAVVMSNQDLLNLLCRSIPNYARMLLDIRDENGGTPLTWAVEYGDCKAVESLLAFGADANTINTDCKSPLEIALTKGNMEAFDLLSRHGGVLPVENLLKFMDLMLSFNKQLVSRLVTESISHAVESAINKGIILCCEIVYLSEGVCHSLKEAGIIDLVVPTFKLTTGALIEAAIRDSAVKAFFERTPEITKPDILERVRDFLAVDGVGANPADLETLISDLRRLSTLCAAWVVKKTDVTASNAFLRTINASFEFCCHKKNI